MSSLDRTSFAYYTVVVNLPDIARRVLMENELPAESQEALEVLLAEIPEGRIRALRDYSAPEEVDWAGYIKPYIGMTWLEIPWFFAEVYFYQRILEATGYFRFGPGKEVDPFEYQKRRGLERSQERVRILCRQLQAWLHDQPEGPYQTWLALAQLIKGSLWGNQADLSIWPVGEEGGPEHQDAQQGGDQVALDETEALIQHFANLEKCNVRVEVILDNAGLELVSDLALVDFLLSKKIATRVQLHLKSHPVFVSDALTKDVDHTLEFLASSGYPVVQALPLRIKEYQRSGELRLREDPFWCSPLSGWEMPEELRQTFNRADLVISKGDINYRRLLGDRNWPHNTPLADIVGYIHAPLVALRVLKGDIVAGVPDDRVEAIKQADPHWMINGKWGLVQFVKV